MSMAVKLCGKVGEQALAQLPHRGRARGLKKPGGDGVAGGATFGPLPPEQGRLDELSDGFGGVHATELVDPARPSPTRR